MTATVAEEHAVIEAATIEAATVMSQSWWQLFRYFGLQHFVKLPCNLTQGIGMTGTVVAFHKTGSSFRNFIELDRTGHGFRGPGPAQQGRAGPLSVL